MQLALFPEQIRLIRVRPEHNEKRYYQIEIVTDLFGAVGLARTWGRIGRSAHSRFDPLPDLGTAIDALRRLARAKRRRGYQDYPSKAERWNPSSGDGVICAGSVRSLGIERSLWT